MSTQRTQFQQKDLRVLNRKMVYCIGVPCNITDQQIQSNGYFGQYGKIKKMVVMNGNKYQNTTSVYITYENQIQAAMAILATNGQIIGRNTLKTIFGTVKYCNYFLKKIACKNLPDCPYLHAYDKKNEIYIKDSVFQVIKDHHDAAKSILIQTPSNKLNWTPNDQNNRQCQKNLPRPEDVLTKFFPDKTDQINSKIVKMIMKKCQSTFTSKYIKDKLAKQDKNTKTKLYQSLCKHYSFQTTVKSGL